MAQASSFSERMGLVETKALQLENMDDKLRNSLWNVCWTFFFKNNGAVLRSEEELYIVAQSLYLGFYKFPINTLPYQSTSFIKEQQTFFQNAEWHRVLDIIEFLGNTSNVSINASFQNFVNLTMERERSAYRFIGGQIAPITNEIEIDEITSSIEKNGRFSPVAEHIKTALAHFSNKQSPDYRNSIKESISAVEAAAKIITNKPQATLPEAIKIIDVRHSLHGAFKEGINRLYGYTSDEGGIRHSLTEAQNVDEADARFMLVSCSAFANYLISRFDEVSEKNN